jgi:hypothetical protein
VVMFWMIRGSIIAVAGGLRISSRPPCRAYPRGRRLCTWPTLPSTLPSFHECSALASSGLRDKPSRLPQPLHRQSSNRVTWSTAAFFACMRSTLPRSCRSTSKLVFSHRGVLTSEKDPYYRP